MMKYKRLMILLILIIIAIAIYTFYGKNTKSSTNISENKTAYLESIKKVMIIPSEEPTYLLIDNAELLSKQQSFFQNAVNGDALFVFQNSGKAIIWSPSRSMIINSGPIEYSPTAATTSQVKK